ncbi:hypothetical protein NMD1_03376 [Novosphingobium sp. MD-1]|nr:hypothetical protein NMD1_03376 [Novosphingobium sp. MD-1]
MATPLGGGGADGKGWARLLGAGGTSPGIAMAKRGGRVAVPGSGKVPES